MPSLMDILNTMNSPQKRMDGTTKGSGYFGPLMTNSGDVSTELSFDFDMGGKRIHAPLLVPTLSPQEISHLLSGAHPTDEIYDKAIQHYIERSRLGKPAFATPLDVNRLPK